MLHPHIHCLVPAGGLSPDRRRWIASQPHFLLPIPILRRVFRGKFIAGLRPLYRKGQLRCQGPAVALNDARNFSQLLRTVHRQPWAVYAKQAMGSPAQVLRYLGRPALLHALTATNQYVLPQSIDALAEETQLLPKIGIGLPICSRTKNQKPGLPERRA